MTVDGPADTMPATVPHTVPGVCLDESTRLDGSAGHYTARLSPEWRIWGPNGGYLATLALRAAGMCADVPHPAGIHATFLRSPRFDDVTLDVVTLKRGRRTEVFAVTMTQDGQPVLSALVQTADMAAGYESQPARPPDLPSPDASTVIDPGGPFPFWANLSRRTPGEHGHATMREWVRFRPHSRFDDPFVDAARSLILLDTYGWPAFWHTYGDGPFIAPSLDITASFHPVDTPSDWLLIDCEVQVGRVGRLGVTGRVWDVDGHLVATGASQLCCVPAPT